MREYPGEKYDKTMLDNIKGRPWDPKGTGVEQGDLLQENLRAGDLERAPVLEPIPTAGRKVRRVPITKELLDKVGFTDDCLKCRHLRTGDRSQPTLGHSENCRRRVETKMKDDPALRERLLRAEERQDDFLAQQVAAGDERPGRPEAAAEEAGPRARVRFRSEGDEPSRGGAPDSKRARPETEGDATGDLPLPAAGDEEDLVEEAADAPGSKRPRLGSESEDPSNPEVEVGAVMFGVLDRRALPHVDRPGKYDVCEVFSPPRVAPHAEKRGLRAGWSLDIKSVDGITGRRWDLLNVKEREMAFDFVRRNKPQTCDFEPTMYEVLRIAATLPKRNRSR